MNRNPAIISIGEVLWDLFPQGPRFGGAPANFACHAALLGGAVSMISAVGRDARGDGALRILAGFGIHTDLIQRVEEAPTGGVGVSVDAGGKPAYEIHANTAWDLIQWGEGFEKRVAAADAVYFGTLGLRGDVSRATIRRLLETAEAHHVVRVLDVNLRAPFYDAALIRESLALASVLKLSDEELPAVAAACGLGSDADTAARPEPLLRALLEKFDLSLVAMTRGAEGALLVSPDETVHQPGIPTMVRDTVGAGDSFTAALVVGLLYGHALTDIARAACETASVVCAMDGAVPPAPAGHFR